MSDTKTTGLDYHLSCEETPQGTALLNASWQTNVPGTRFNMQVEALTDHSVNEAISFLSELQSRVTDLIVTWSVVNRPKP